MLYEKILLIFLCCITVLLLCCLTLTNYQNQPLQNTPEQVLKKLQSLYDVDFKYVDSVSESEGSIIYRFYSCINPKFVVNASYCYAGDPYYIFPFARRIVFRDDLAKQIQDYYIHNTFREDLVYLSIDSMDDVANSISLCINNIEAAFSRYNVDKNLNMISISIDFLLDNHDVVSLEFSDSNYEKIKSKMLYVLYEAIHIE